MGKLSIVSASTTDELQPMNDLELDQQIIALLEDNKRLRHELKGKRYAYELAMNINNRYRVRIETLEAEKKMTELVNSTFNQPKKLKVA